MIFKHGFLVFFDEMKVHVLKIGTISKISVTATLAQVRAGMKLTESVERDTQHSWRAFIPLMKITSSIPCMAQIW